MRERKRGNQEVYVRVSHRVERVRGKRERERERKREEEKEVVSA